MIDDKNIALVNPIIKTEEDINVTNLTNAALN